MFESITKKSHPKEWALILKAFPGYRKRLAKIGYTDSVALSGRYWDGGSRTVWAVIKHGVVSQIASRNDFPFTEQDIEVELTKDVVAISTGTFCGKPAYAYIYMVKKLSKLTAKLAQLEQELKDEGISLETLGDKVDELKDISIEMEPKLESSSEPLQWVAYCTTCQQELISCPNGAFAEASAKRHKKTHVHTFFKKLKHSHKVIVGTYIK